MRRLPFVGTAGLALLAGLLAGGGARAQITLIFDQSFSPDDGSFIGNVGFGETVERAQTFTVGATGLLVEIQVRILQQQEGDLFFHLLPTQNGVPVEDLGLALASRIIPSGTAPASADSFPIDLSASHVEVTEGQVLALVLGANTPQGGYSWFGQAPASYERGGAFERFLPAGTWTPSMPGDQPADLGFQTIVAPPVYTHVTWPRDTAGCDDVNDLEACIQTGVASGAVIEIATDVVPEQDVLISPGKSFALRPAPGFQPVFQGVSSIRARGGDPDVTVAIEGLTFESGSLDVLQAGSGFLDVTIRDNEIRQTLPSQLFSIRIASTNTTPPYGSTRFLVEDNRIEIDAGPAESVSGIVVTGFQGGGGLGLVRGNRIHQVGGAGRPVIGLDNGSATLDVDVIGNLVSGTDFNAAIAVSQFGDGQTFARIADNSLSGQVDDSGVPAALALSVSGGNASFLVLNNTIAHNENGLRLVGSPDLGATATALVANNIVAFNAEAGLSIEDFESSVTDEFNLLFANGFDLPTPGPGTVLLDPLFVAADDLSLQPGSPARDAGSNAHAPAEITVDVLGQPRIVGGIVDIGAYEAPEPSAAAAVLAAFVALATLCTVTQPRSRSTPTPSPIRSQVANAP